MPDTIAGCALTCASFGGRVIGHMPTVASTVTAQHVNRHTHNYYALIFQS